MSFLKSRFYLSVITIQFLVVVFAVPAFSSPTVSPPTMSRGTWAHVLGTSERIGVESAGARCFETFVPARGVLMLEVSAAGESSARPVIDFLGSAGAESGRPSFRVLERWATSGLFEVREAGSRLFCVRSQDPGRGLDGVKLTSAFVASAATKGINPDEDEEDPDPLRFFASGLCGLESDDHADVFHCASALAAGQEVHARIDNSQGDDEDVFSIVVGDLATYRFETSGDVKTFFSLYDRFGQRLQIDAEPDTGFFETLSPGTYYLRVSARYGEQGDYQLRVTTTER